MSALGYWREPDATPTGSITWQAPGKTGLQTHIGIVAGKAVAWLKRNPSQRGFTVRITGWMWTSFPAESTTAKLGMKESPVRWFPTLKEAKHAVADALALLPTKASEATV